MYVLIDAQFGQPAVRIENAKAVNHLVLFHRVVIYKSDGLIIPFRVVSQFTQDHFAPVARTVDQNSTALVYVRDRQQFPNQPERKPAAYKAKKQDDTVKHKNGAGKILKAINEDDKVELSKQLNAPLDKTSLTKFKKKADSKEATDFINKLKAA